MELAEQSAEQERPALRCQRCRGPLREVYVSLRDGRVINAGLDCPGCAAAAEEAGDE